MLLCKMNARAEGLTRVKQGGTKQKINTAWQMKRLLEANDVEGAYWKFKFSFNLHEDEFARARSVNHHS